MKILAILCAIFITAEAVSDSDVLHEQWNLFKAQYQKKYESRLEEKFRMKVFAENLIEITRHNRLYQKRKVSHELAMNRFGDLLRHEFVKVMLGFHHSGLSKLNDDIVTFIEPYNVTLPKAVNWTAEGAVTGVKNQGHCGSCWAFSATGALEGQHFRKTGKLISLSEQNLIDCTLKYGNHGCKNGSMLISYMYIRNNEGIDTETSYPYEAMVDQCRYDATNSGATGKGFVYLPQGDENKLRIAVATVGPISAAVDADHFSFQFYKRGVYYEKECNPMDLPNHAVLVVGYGTTNAGIDYWLVKNSWGADWGDQGYIKMARDMDNNCHIATTATYPLV